MKKLIMLMFLAFASWGVYAQHDHSGHDSAMKMEQKGHPKFKDEKTGQAYDQYIQLKEALVASRQEDVTKAAKQLKQALDEVGQGEKAAAEASKMASAASLDAQRKAFASLTDEMTTLLKNSDVTEGAIYVAYCPMANGHEGGYWLSNEKEIRNPYFGDKMMKCGSVKETIE